MVIQLEANLNPPERMPIKCCDWCDKDLYAGDKYYSINGETICQNCIDECAMELEED